MKKEQITNRCRPDDQLRRFMDRQVTPQEEAACLRHLDECPTCCQRLEMLAAEPEEWAEVPALLGSFGDSPRDMLRSVLDPTDDPSMLGRLGPYEVMGIIGSGGMGLVLKAHDRALGRNVAIKVLAPQWSASGLARRRFAREARAAAAVVHEHVIAVHAVAEVHGVPYLVMPYFPAQSLQHRIDQAAPLQLVEILRISHQIASGLAAAHAEGLIHRDIKPANILLEHGIERVVITDFGLARTADDASLTRSGVLAGTPQYMAPEQARGVTIDYRADLFSLGSVMYAMCTGRPPFRAESPLAVLRRISDEQPTPIREVAPEIPDWFVEIVDRLHKKNPADRFSSAAELAVLLKGWLAHVQNPLQVAAPRKVANEKTRRFDMQSWLAAGLLVVLASGAVLSFLDQESPDRRPQSTRLPEMSLDDQWLAVREMQAIAEAIQPRVWHGDGTFTEPELISRPIMRTFDPARGKDGTRQEEGAVWMWGRSGRPVALLEMWRLDGATTWGHALISTTTDPISADVGEQTWQPEKPGLTFHPLDDVPRPAPFREIRAKQMLEIAQRFSGWEVLSLGEEKLNLSLEPIHSYHTANFDGAMFALLHYWNPEAILFLEAASDAEVGVSEEGQDSTELSHWRFAVVPCSSHELHITYRQQKVVTIPAATNYQGTPAEPLWVFPHFPAAPRVESGDH